MIEKIGTNSDDLSVLINNFVKKAEIKPPKEEEEIKDSYLPAKESETFSTYNKKGSVPKDHVVLPDRYNTGSLAGYIYYKGERMSQLELLEKAVESGAIELDEEATIGSNYDRAWEALVESKAKPLYDWSTSLYSEDGMYKFRVENGEITGMALARNGEGVFFSEIVKDLANGIRPADMTTDTSYLAHLDPELFDAACQIGSAKRMYDNGYDKSLFDILFGFDIENNQINFAAKALENFNWNRYSNWFKRNT